MRTVSIFFDTKLISSNQNLSTKSPEVNYSLQTPRSLVCSNFQGFRQPNLFGQNITCEKHATCLSHVSSGKAYSFASRKIKDVRSISKIKLFFRSFEAKDLQDSLDIFQNYLCSLTNQLSTLQKYQPLVDHKPLTEWQPLGYKIITPGGETKERKPVSGYYKGQINAARLDLQTLGQSRPFYQRSQNITEGTRNSKGARAIICRGVVAKQPSVLKAVSLLRALRDIHSSLNVLSVPQRTSLYTVIKSPHVFKKTREQFATTANKKVLTIHLASKVARSLVLESFLLLKLPCEVKIKA